MARYANRGEATGLYAGGTVSTSAEYSLTGTAVTGISSSATVTAASVGFDGISEIWGRFDVYCPSGFYGNLGAIWDDKPQSSGTGIYHRGVGGLAISYYNSNGSRVNEYWLSTIPSSRITTVQFHIHQYGVEFWVNNVKKASYSGATAGSEITYFRIATENNYFSNIIIADYDCTQETLAGGAVSLSADTLRTLAGNVAIHGDTVRLLGNAVTISADTLRTLTAGQEVTLHGDTLRTIANDITIHADTERTLTNDSQVTLSADTLRRLGTTVSLKADTARNVINRVTIHADAVRNIPRVIENYTGSGIQSVSLTLAEKTLSDTFRMVTANPFSLQDTVQGRLLDFPYTFRVESTSQRDLLQTIQGMYDVDALMYNALKYTVPDAEKEKYQARLTNETVETGGIMRGVSAATVARKCAAGMSKNAVVAFDDFFPTSAQADTITNYQSILGGIFSWTSQVPRRQINVFIRQGSIHFLQRGYESGVISLDGYTHTRPTVERRIVRTMVTGGGVDGYDSGAGKKWEWGDWYWSGTDRTPRGGSVGPSGGNSSAPSVSYNSDGLVSQSVERIENSEGVTVVTTSYQYEKDGRSTFLVSETIETEQNGEIIEKKTIDHYPLNNGQRYSVGYNEDGDATSGMGTYPYSDKISNRQKMVWQISRDGHWVTVQGETLTDSISIPVNDRATITAVYNELKWMNRRTQETVSFDVVGNVANGVSEITHVFDFDTRYTLGGAEYYLVSNTVNLNPRQLTQTLTLVRWY